MLMSRFRFKLNSVAVALAVFLSVSTASAAELSNYSDNVNVARLDKYLSSNTTDFKRLSKTALFAGYAILYDFALKPGGVEKLLAFSRECYEKAFLSNEMKNISACYTAINVVTDQVEKAAKVKV